MKNLHLFRGELRVSPVSGRPEMFYPPGKTIKKVILHWLGNSVLYLQYIQGSAPNLVETLISLLDPDLDP
jgi:hypothetical protein